MTVISAISLSIVMISQQVKLYYLDRRIDRLWKLIDLLWARK